MREEIFLPLGMDDCWVGMPPDRREEYGDRIGTMHNTQGDAPVPLDLLDSADTLAKCIPGGGGRGPMRQLARLYRALLGRGELDGVRILVAADGRGDDRAPPGGPLRRDLPLRVRLGSRLRGRQLRDGPPRLARAFGHGGALSSYAFADPEHDLVVAIQTNGMCSSDDHYRRLDETMTALYLDLGDRARRTQRGATSRCPKHAALMAEMPIGAAVRQLSEQQPERPAITCEGVTVLWRDLEPRTNRLAHTLARRGVGQGDFVTIGLPNGIAFYETCIAAWKLGATPQPVSWRLPEREREEIVALVQPAIVVTSPIEPDADASDEPILPDRIAPAFKAPTSGGSTGRPKIIVSGQDGTTDPDTPFSLGGRVRGQTELVAGPLYHNGPFVFSVPGLLSGGHLVVMPRFDASEALELIERYRVEWMMLVPTMMLRIWRLPEAERLGRDVSSLRAVLHLAAPCPAWLKHEWINWLGADAIWELYAGTEAQGVTLITGEEWLAARGVGRPAASGPHEDHRRTGQRGARR